MNREATLVALVVMTAARVFAQAPLSPAVHEIATFEVASVRPNVSVGDGRMAGGAQPGGRFALTHATPWQLVLMAYSNVPLGRIAGFPDWARQERYDVQAKAEGAPEDIRPYLRGLLRDRFGLRVHVESRPVPAYLLLPAREDRRLGTNLTPAAMDCDNQEAVQKARQSRRPGEPLCNGVAGRNRIWMNGMTIDSLSNALASIVERPVINRTDLRGRFDLDLNYVGMADLVGPTVSNGTSIFTAVQEQLGLRLQAADVEMEVLVIDRLERPTPD